MRADRALLGRTTFTLRLPILLVSRLLELGRASWAMWEEKGGGGEGVEDEEERPLLDLGRGCSEDEGGAWGEKLSVSGEWRLIAFLSLGLVRTIAELRE